MVERDEPLDQLTQLLAGCAEGRGATGVISGGAGLGKTALLEALSERAAGRGHVVLGAVGSRAESEFPYAVLEQLFQGAELAGSSANLRPLLERAAELGEWDPVLSTAQVMQASYRMLVELTVRRPVVICIDDVQYSDLQSLQCLLYLIRRCRRIPVAIFLAHGLPGTTESQNVLAELACRPGIRYVRLGALTQEGVAHLITDRFGQGAAERYAPEFLQATGGNHLLVQALMSDHATHWGREDAGHCLMAGDVFRDTSLACVRRGGPDVLRVARGIAVLDGVGSPAVLGQLIGLEDRAIVAAVKILTESMLFNGVRFRHPTIQAVVLDDIPAEDRMHLHRRAGWLLREEGAQAIVVAPHLLASGRVEDEWAAPLLVEAADQALSGDQVSLAIRCLQLADTCCQDEHQRHLTRVTLAQIMWRDRPEASTRVLQTLVGPAKAGALPGVTGLTVAYGLLVRGECNDAVEIVEQVCASKDKADQKLAFELDVARLWLASTYPGASMRLEHSLPRPSVQHPMPTPPSGMPRLTANRVLWTVLARGADESVSAEAERVLQSVLIGDGTMDTLMSAILALVYADRLKTAASWCDRFLAKAAERHAPTWNALLSSARALVALRQGELRVAAGMAEAALKHMSEEAWGVGIGMPLATLIESSTAMGNHEAVTELVNRPVPEALFQTRFGLHYLHARGRHHLAKGYHDAALADFLACGEKLRIWELDSPALAPWRIGAAEVWLRRGQRERAAKLADEHLALAGRGQRRTQGMALRILAATRAPSQQLELLGKALEMLQPTGDRYQVALTLAALGRAHQRNGGAGKARLIVRQAWHMAKECGAEELRSSLMPKPAGGTQPEVVGLPSADTKATSLLSVAEMRVTALAVRGYTNREISSKLFITVSTVEQHLTRVYRKLNIRHRQELPASLVS